MRAKANIDDVLENVTAAVKIRNSVIIVTIWIVNLHFFVASARSVGCNSGRCCMFFCFFYFTVWNCCGSLSLLKLAHTVSRLSKQALELGSFVKLNLHHRPTIAQLSEGGGKHVEHIAVFQWTRQIPDVGSRGFFSPCIYMCFKWNNHITINESSMWTEMWAKIKVGEKNILQWFGLFMSTLFLYWEGKYGLSPHKEKPAEFIERSTRTLTDRGRRQRVPNFSWDDLANKKGSWGSWSMCS